MSKGRTRGKTLPSRALSSIFESTAACTRVVSHTALCSAPLLSVRGVRHRSVCPCVKSTRACTRASCCGCSRLQCKDHSPFSCKPGAVRTRRLPQRNAISPRRRTSHHLSLSARGGPEVLHLSSRRSTCVLPVCECGALRRCFACL